MQNWSILTRIFYSQEESWPIACIKKSIEFTRIHTNTAQKFVLHRLAPHSKLGGYFLESLHARHAALIDTEDHLTKVALPLPKTF